MWHFTQNKKLVKVSQKVGRYWSPCINQSIGNIGHKSSSFWPAFRVKTSTPPPSHKFCTVPNHDLFVIPIWPTSTEFLFWVLATLYCIIYSAKQCMCLTIHLTLLGTPSMSCCVWIVFWDPSIICLSLSVNFSLLTHGNYRQQCVKNCLLNSKYHMDVVCVSKNSYILLRPRFLSSSTSTWNTLNQMDYINTGRDTQTPKSIILM